MANLLGNKHRFLKGIQTANPYRFVFLDGCSTARKKTWHRAFGIVPMKASSQVARNKVGPQAFVGWAKEHTGYYYTANRLKAYTETLNAFYVLWMSGHPLASCLDFASEPAFVDAPLPVPGNENVVVDGIPVGKRATSKLYVVGHSGLTVNGLNTSWDNYKPYRPPYQY